MPRNAVLAQSLAEGGISTTMLAAEVGVDSKTAERWVSQGRVPHPRHRQLVGKLLNRSAVDLWPSEATAAAAAQPPTADLVRIYPSRRDVPMDTWRALMAGTTRQFDLHAFAATFLPDQAMDMATELIALAEAGVSVRLLLGDPDGAAVRLREDEEGGPGLSGRIRLVFTYIAAAINHPGIQVRLHSHTLYASMFRFDDDVLVNTHVWGSPAGNNPLLHLRTGPGLSLADGWIAGFERIWAQAEPLPVWPRSSD